tara:strand:+ start:540 stop:953 length:414 start_codon:yes stop_codon:yes gene_type:complete
MLEILKSCLALVLGLLVALWDVVQLVLVWAWDVVYHLHMTAPRLEGLLIGVTLTWLLLRRDRHPVLRVLSAPLKLILDIIDLAWDQVVEVASDVWTTVKGWTSGALSWVWNRLTGTLSGLTGLLAGLRDKLRSKKED